MNQWSQSISFQSKQSVFPDGLNQASKINYQKVGYFKDPITAKAENIHHVPVDHLLDYEYPVFDKFLHRLKTVFVTTPQAVWRGLKGAPDFTFSDFSTISGIPYYAGGAMLAYSFMAAGASKVPFVRMLSGILLYYGLVGGTNKVVNWLHKKAHGIDLDLKYRRADGRVENVYSSIDFARFDLLRAKEYNTAREKMGLPDNIADPNHAVREQIRRIIAVSTASKLIMGNMLAAIGAGYLCRTESAAALLSLGRNLKAVWHGNVLNNIGSKVARSASVIGTTLSRPLGEKFAFSRSGSKFLPIATGVALLGAAYTLYKNLTVIRLKNYESSPAFLLNREKPFNQSSVFRSFISNREVNV